MSDGGTRHPDEPRGRKLIVFADGTGNAFGHQESNIWRLYQTLDRLLPDQKSIYIQGVGTSGNAIIAKLDGATGFGVPSNVRKLYSFLCWNWEPGDEIYMFGFSRGAFTVRCLAGLIASQGLMPKRFDGRLLTTAELDANAKGAWRAYRASTAPFRWSHFFEDIKTLSPSVALIRHLRDLLIALWRRTSGSPLHREILAKTLADHPQRAPGEVTIAFLGLFDTVEAYGLPVEEFRAVVNWAIWPISFRNRLCSPIVKTIRHALSLDDERTTFHPIRFDQSQDAKVEGEGKQRTLEVWFAGMHSDVGGGYADDSLALNSFAWMADEASKAGLRFDAAGIKSLKDRASPLAPIHNSREGLASLYRYDPRRITQDPRTDGGPPIIHHSVAQKIVFGIGRYAPIKLPSRVKVLAADGRIETIVGDNQSLSAPSTPPSPARPDEEAIGVLLNCPPRKDLIERASTFVVWRRITYFLLVLSTLSIALMPILGPFLEGLFDPARGTEAGDKLEASVHTLVEFPGEWAGMLLPGFISPWVEALQTYSRSMLVCIGLWCLFYILNARLHDRIRDYAYEAWAKHDGKSSRLLRGDFLLDWTGRRLVGPFWRLVHRTISRYVAPAAFSLAVVLLLIVALSRGTMSVLTRSGYICPKSQIEETTLGPGKRLGRDGFSPKALCWPTSVRLVSGQTYTLWIDPKEPFVDQTIVTDPGGFTSNSLVHLLTQRTIRRLGDGAWLQPIAQIGVKADTVFPLVPADGRRPPLAKSWRRLPMKQSWRSLEASDQAAFLAHRDLVLRSQIDASTDKFVTRFTATEDGPLYLYVNDVVVALPLLGAIPVFYDNNEGGARVTIIRDPLPAVAEERSIVTP